jgi:hypothetical protein
MMRQPEGWLTKDGALELLSLSLNNSKGFSKKAMKFSEFQAFRITRPLVWPTILLPLDLVIKLSSAQETTPCPWPEGRQALGRPTTNRDRLTVAPGEGSGHFPLRPPHFSRRISLLN